MLDRNRSFCSKAALSRIIFSDDRIKQHMKVINSRFKDTNFDELDGTNE